MESTVDPKQREALRGRIAAVLNQPENRRMIYELAIKRSNEIQSGVCRVVAGLPDPADCPCAACRV